MPRSPRIPSLLHRAAASKIDRHANFLAHLNAQVAHHNKFILPNGTKRCLGLFLFRSTNERIIMSYSTRKIVPLGAILIGAVGLSGCATKSYVREQIAPVSQRVDALESRLQETDGTARAALAEAQAASAQAQNNAQRLDQVNGRVNAIDQRIQEQERRGKRPRN